MSFSSIRQAFRAHGSNCASFHFMEQRAWSSVLAFVVVTAILFYAAQTGIERIGHIVAMFSAAAGQWIVWLVFRWNDRGWLAMARTLALVGCANGFAMCALIWQKPSLLSTPEDWQWGIVISLMCIALQWGIWLVACWVPSRFLETAGFFHRKSK